MTHDRQSELTGVSADVRFATSQDEFRQLVLEVEGDGAPPGARSLDRVAQRMFVIFKKPEAIEAIAAGRFGEGTPSYAAYKEEHRRRKQLFETGMDDGSLRCRELYSRKELLQYAKDRRHGTVVLGKEHLEATFGNWRSRLVSSPVNYQVRVADAQLPIKYSIGNVGTRSMTMIHNGVQIETPRRLMGLLLTGEDVARPFRADFDMVWNNAAAESPDNGAVVRWIDDVLLPALRNG